MPTILDYAVPNLHLKGKAMLSWRKPNPYWNNYFAHLAKADKNIYNAFIEKMNIVSLSPDYKLQKPGFRYRTFGSHTVPNVFDHICFAKDASGYVYAVGQPYGEGIEKDHHHMDTDAAFYNFCKNYEFYPALADKDLSWWFPGWTKLYAARIAGPTAPRKLVVL